jgi:hypothetical protein
MSRVEDDRQAQRTTERIVQEKRLQESKTKQKQEGASAFSKLVQQQQTPQARAQQPQQPQQPLGKSVLARLTQEAQTSKKQDENVRQSSTSEGQRTTEGRQTDSALSSLLGDSRHVDQDVSDMRTESRTEDSRSSNDALDERKGAEGGAHAGRGKGALKTDADGGGGKGGGGDKKDGNAEMAAGFRFNPALMAPVPVAKPKPNTGSERLRQIANEIAQKIVERVRVGTNAAGNAEFQIDLRNDVLSGLSIKLSAKNGKISAVFSGRDRDVLKMLEEQKESLAAALKGRGLTLEDLRIETKT